MSSPPAQELRAIAAMRSVSMRRLAAAAAMSYWTVSRILAGTQEPTLEQLRALRVTLATLDDRKDAR